MSGICFLLNKGRGRAADAASLSALVDPVRGAGGAAAQTLSGNAGLAAFATLGEDSRSLLFEDEGLIVACDAEIYNRRDFPEGKDDGFSEAALIAALFRRHGKDWWKGVQGVYGAFVWDKRAGKGWAFRDRIGVKPMVWWEDADRIVVASRMRSVWSQPWFKRDIDPQAVYSYLNMEVIPTPYSIFKGIRKLESGFLLEVTEAGARPHEAWTMTFPPEKIRDGGEISKRTYEHLREAVRLQMIYREPLDEVGSFLSGGTDSSSIAGMMNELFPGRARTFSMGFDESGFDEMHYCRLAAKAFATQQNEYYVTPDDILAGLPLIVDAYDEPFANSSAIPSYFCAKMAREKGVKAMLGGDGGDEIFGGNSRYREVFQLSNRLPGWFVGGVAAPALAMLPRFAHKGPVRDLDRYVFRARAPFHEKVYSYNLPHYMDLEDIFTPAFLEGRRFVTPAEITKAYFDRAGTPDDLDKFLYNDIKITLMDNDLPKVNRMTELAGIKVRYPFLDARLVEFTGRIPPGEKVKGNRLRHAFKEAMKGLLPGEIIEKKKHGFGIPVAKWMLRPGKLNDLLKDVVFDPRTSQRGFFRKSFIEGLYKRSAQDATTFYGTYLYYVFFLELWMRKHVDR